MTDDNFPDGEVESDFPALIRPLLDDNVYAVRDDLFDENWLYFVTGIDYEAFVRPASRDRD